MLCGDEVCAQGVEEFLVGFFAAIASDYGGAAGYDVPGGEVSDFRYADMGDAGSLTR